MQCKPHLIALGAVAAVVLTLSAVSQTTKPEDPPRKSPNTVTRIDLPLQVPAVGNLDAVKTWRFGRIESVVRTVDQTDIVLTIRIASGEVLTITAPGPPLADLALASDWVRFADSKTMVGRSDYVERMIAFDVDETGRLIAMASLEPINRNERRMRRAFGG
jgi:hypothetical protein